MFLIIFQIDVLFKKTSINHVFEFGFNIKIIMSRMVYWKTLFFGNNFFYLEKVFIAKTFYAFSYLFFTFGFENIFRV